MRLRNTVGRVAMNLPALVAAAAVSFLPAGPLSSAQSANLEAEPAAVAPTRLTQEQYKNIIEDTFGADILIGGRLEPDVREQGLLAIGAAQVSVSAAGIEQYDAVARSIAAQVLDPAHRATLVPCRPQSIDKPDDACARKFVAGLGSALFRRPLAESSVRLRVKVAREATEKLGDFYAGLRLTLEDMLISPQFLFRKDQYVTLSGAGGKEQLDPYSKASRLSFFLWNSGPSPALLAAAAAGELDTPSSTARVVDRMLSSPLLDRGVRAFFSDMMHFDEYASLSKDAAIFPKFTSAAASDAPEQTLRTIVDHLVTQQGDYRDLFTTRRTFLTRSLAALYGVPLPVVLPNGAPPTWVAHEYPADAPYAGLLSHASFLTLHSHPGRTSPTLRGKALREIFFCQRVPDPPGDVDLSILQDTNSPLHRTARARLSAHSSNPVCAGCHKITDPIGLALENFDSAAGYRTTENRIEIDPTGELEGKKFSNAVELAHVVRNNPALPSCLVERMSSYFLGRPLKNEDRAQARSLQTNFMQNGYRIAPLMREIALAGVNGGLGDVPQVANE